MNDIGHERVKAEREQERLAEHQRNLEIAQWVKVWNAPQGGGATVNHESSVISSAACGWLFASVVVYCATQIYLAM